jgi:hypothetical protein
MANTVGRSGLDMSLMCEEDRVIFSRGATNLLDAAK